jgi:hypothetical protein
MSSEEITKVGTPVGLAEAARSAGQAAAAGAADALAAAAANAAKPGASSTEFKATIGSIALAAGLAALKAFALVPGPWTLPAALVLVGVTASSAAYSLSRGSVKKAALAGAAAVAAAAMRPAPAPATSADDSAVLNAG